MDLKWKDPPESDDIQGEEWVKGLQGRETTEGPAWGRKSSARQSLKESQGGEKQWGRGGGVATRGRQVRAWENILGVLSFMVCARTGSKGPRAALGRC